MAFGTITGKIKLTSSGGIDWTHELVSAISESLFSSGMGICMDKIEIGPSRLEIGFILMQLDGASEPKPNRDEIRAAILKVCELLPGHTHHEVETTSVLGSTIVGRKPWLSQTDGAE